jgi:holo-[acyl-carrier protein] synthase
MAPIRVGTDVQSIDEVAAAIERYGDRYTRRLFTSHEMSCCPGTSQQSAPGLAARFAAKEATLKALRPTEKVPRWTSIEVRRAAGGWCELELHDEAAELADEAGLSSFSLSISHGAGIGAATVVAEQRADRG